MVSAVARFAVGAAGFGTRYYDINIGSDDFADGSFGVFFLGGASESGAVLGSALLTLSDTGAVDYTITNESSQWYKKLSLAWAKLDVRADYKSIPDSGSTLLLLGLGLIGLFVAHRRSSS